VYQKKANVPKPKGRNVCRGLWLFCFERLEFSSAMFCRLFIGLAIVYNGGGKKSLRISERFPNKLLSRLLKVILFKFSTICAMFFTACYLLASFISIVLSFIFAKER
jgi:hypothetical protein